VKLSKLFKMNKTSGKINDETKLSCYQSNEATYPLCKGAKHPQEFAENDCVRCCLYEEAQYD
jgi:hypothetical protein